MNAEIKFLLSMACTIPATVGLFRLKNTGSQYHPFIYMMILAVLLETVVYCAPRYAGLPGLSIISINLFMLINLGLFLYFVFLNNYLSKKAMLILLALALLTAIFNFIFERSFKAIFYYLLCFVSVVMLVISTNILSKQVMEIKYRLTNNFWFWASSFLIIANAFNFLIFGTYIFALFKIDNGKEVGTIQHIANAICYLFFAFAILKIPKKDN